MSINAKVIIFLIVTLLLIGVIALLSGCDTPYSHHDGKTNVIHNTVNTLTIRTHTHKEKEAN